MREDVDYGPCGGDGVSPSWSACSPELPFCRPDGTCAYPVCEDVRPYCQHDSEAGTRARQLCPQTCGCDRPLSGLLLQLPTNGCSRRCTKTEVYKEALRTMPCEDLPYGDPALTALADHWELVAQVAVTRP